LQPSFGSAIIFSKVKIFKQNINRKIPVIGDYKGRKQKNIVFMYYDLFKCSRLYNYSPPPAR
jgi:hypothetical protein